MGGGGAALSDCGPSPGWPAPSRCSPHSQTSSHRSAPGYNKLNTKCDAKAQIVTDDDVILGQFLARLS